MLVGVHLPQWGSGATRDGVVTVARAAERAGLDSVWVADHVVYPLYGDSEYPYRGGGVPFEPEDGFLDAITTLAVVAGVTSRVRLGTSILVAPMREPLQLAKAVATLDVLSNGRVVLGLGAGWWKEEFDALGAEFEARGRRFDEQLAILQSLWRDGRLEHHGRFFDFDEVVCEPRPVQPGGPPLLIGGMGERAHRRAATLGDGWHAVGAKVEALDAGHATVRKLASELGRDPDSLLLSTSAGLPAEPEEAIRRLRRLSRAGVGNVVLNLPATGVPEMCAAIEVLTAQVLPEVRDGPG